MAARVVHIWRRGFSAGQTDNGVRKNSVLTVSVVAPQGTATSSSSAHVEQMPHTAFAVAVQAVRVYRLAALHGLQAWRERIGGRVSHGRTESVPPRSRPWSWPPPQPARTSHTVSLVSPQGSLTHWLAAQVLHSVHVVSVDDVQAALTNSPAGHLRVGAAGNM